MGSFLSIHPPEVCSEWRKIPKCQSMFGLAQWHIVLLCAGHNTARERADGDGGWWWWSLESSQLDSLSSD